RDQGRIAREPGAAAAHRGGARRPERHDRRGPRRGAGAGSAAAVRHRDAERLMAPSERPARGSAGPIVLSLVPGRVSLRYLPARDRHSLANGIVMNLRQLSGVSNAAASPLTARILVFFDTHTVTLDEIVACVRCASP